jgi:hypothetical protein
MKPAQISKKTRMSSYEIGQILQKAKKQCKTLVDTVEKENKDCGLEATMRGNASQRVVFDQEKLS